MSTLYVKCPADVQELMKAVMEKHHADLVSAAVLGVCIFADAGVDADDRPKPAVMLHGYPCAGTIKKTAPKDRAAGMPDMIIMLDRWIWEKLSEKSRRALLDHELCHLELERDDKGHLRLDCCNRPVLSERKHDWHLSGFNAVVDRHGQAALESIEMVRLLQSESGQQFFKFIYQPAGKRKKAA